MPPSPRKLGLGPCTVAAPGERVSRRGLPVAIEVNGALVGSSGVTFAGPRLGPEIGYWQKDPRAPRPSHARAGTLHGGQWALGLGAPRVHLWVDVENTPSQAVARRAGFVQEGVVRAALDRRDGSRADAVLFGRVP